MLAWLPVTVVVASIGILVIVIVIIKRCFCARKRTDVVVDANQERAQNLQTGISKLHQVSLHHLDRDGSKKTNYYVFRRGASARSFFSWADYPSLVTDAVENGWSRFAFSTYTSSPSIRSARSLLGPCAVGDHDREMEVETGWEVCQGSADFVQKIRLNSGLKKIASTNINSLMSAKSATRTALPLPGPPLGNSAFPQEAYFEVIILVSNEDDSDLIGKVKAGKSEGEKAKLIQEDLSLIHVTSLHSTGNSKLEELKFAGKEDCKTGTIVLSVGLAGGGALPLKFPGSYPASIGFNSNGSVYLDGIKLVYESEKEEWGRAETVIGCGYNPSLKKVFFTVDSQLVHEIYCKSQEFGTPLYPTLAANSDITVLVNLGQCAFKYAPANLYRTPNPCFIGPMANSPAIGNEDSKELFSMGRIDSQWLNRSTTRSHNNTGNISTAADFDEESEGDLFEIVLDRIGKSPSTSTL